MSKQAVPEFYVGYAPAPPRLARFLAGVTLIVLASAYLLALALGSQVQERGGGRFVGDTRATGVLLNAPYPLLLLPPSPDFPQGRTLLIAGGGKNGVGAIAEKMNGGLVEIRGFGLKRGSLDMIVADDASNIQPVSGASAPSRQEPVSLGRFSIAGEICDGKCYAGGMRPGTGLAHKACANLCIVGEQPAVFATQAPVQGQSFLLLAGKDGGLPPPVLYNYTGLPAVLEGEVVRLGDLLIFRADWPTLRRQ